MESTWGTSGFADFFGAKLHTACTFSKEEILCQSCYMGVSQFCHVTVVSQLCQLWLCQTSHDNGISSLEHWYVILYDIMWHTVTQMSHSIAQKCHTYDDPVTLEILVDIDTCRFSWFSIRLLVFGPIQYWTVGRRARRLDPGWEKDYSWGIWWDWPIDILIRVNYDAMLPVFGER